MFEAYTTRVILTITQDPKMKFSIEMQGTSEADQQISKVLTEDRGVCKPSVVCGYLIGMFTRGWLADRRTVRVLVELIPCAVCTAIRICRSQCVKF